jgi:hypothetical protein
MAHSTPIRVAIVGSCCKYWPLVVLYFFFCKSHVYDRRPFVGVWGFVRKKTKEYMFFGF